MSIDLENIESRLNAATDGEWKVYTTPKGGHRGVSSSAYDHRIPNIVRAEESYDGYGNGSSRADAEFIAHSKEDIKSLITEVKKLRKQKQQWFVTAVDEDGYVNVYGPYKSEKKAEQASGEIMDADMGQKTFTHVTRAEKFVTADDEN